MSAEYTHQPEIAAIIGDPTPLIDVYSRQLGADTRFTRASDDLALAARQLSDGTLGQIIESTVAKLASGEDMQAEEQQLATGVQAMTRAGTSWRAAGDQHSAAYKDGNSMEQKIGEALSEIPAAHYVTRAIGALCDPLGKRWGQVRAEIEIQRLLSGQNSLETTLGSPGSEPWQAHLFTNTVYNAQNMQALQLLVSDNPLATARSFGKERIIQVLGNPPHYSTDTIASIMEKPPSETWVEQALIMSRQIEPCAEGLLIDRTIF